MKEIIKIGSQPGVIVLIHGSGGNPNMFSHIIEDSSIRNTIVCPNLPGHTLMWSTNPSKDYTISLFNRYILNFIKDFDEQVLLVGHSLGGHLAIDIANHLPNICGIVVMGTPPLEKPLNLEEVYEPNPLGSIFYQEKPDAEILDQAMKAALINQAKMEDVITAFNETDSEFRKLFPASFGEVANERKIWKDLTIPKYLLHGEKDPFVSLNYLEEVNSESNSNLLVLDNCGHYPHLENPEQFRSIILQIAHEVF